MKDTKLLLPTRLRWPGIERHAATRVASCLQCQSSTPTYHRNPLQPTTAAFEPMEHLRGDHWGPSPDNAYVLVIISLLTRYPEVEIVKNTSAEANIQANDSIFSQNYPPKIFLTNEGPPWNTGPDQALKQEGHQEPNHEIHQ